jgi:hypothetical protein
MPNDPITKRIRKPKYQKLSESLVIKTSCFDAHKQSSERNTMPPCPTPSQTNILFRPGDAAAGEQTAERDQGIRTAAEEA